MGNPKLQQAFIALVGLGFVVAAALLPKFSAWLLPVAAGLIGWASPAPGHGGDKPNAEN